MLIGSGMEHIVRTIFPEQGIHTGNPADTRHDDLSLDIRKILVHHQPDIMLWCLRLVNEDHRGRLKVSYLSDHLRTDRTGRACDKDTFVF